IVDPWAAPIGLVFIVAALFAWHRPSADAWDLEWARGGPPGALPASALALSRGVRPPVWWGMLLFLAIEATLFAAFLTSYYYIRTNSEEWPHFGLDLPDLMLPAVASAVLLTSALPVLLAYTGIRRGYQGW